MAKIKNYRNTSLFLGIVVSALLMLIAIHFIILKVTEEKIVETVSFDLKDIKKRGYLIALTDKNSFNYFAYRGRIMGFQYDMLRKLTDFLKVNLRIIAENDFEKSVYMLQTGQCDIIATYITITKDRRMLFDFTEPIMTTRQVLVQRQAESQNDSIYINNVLELAQKEVYTKSQTSYHRRLINLSEEIGDSIHIIESPDFSTEMLIQKVAKGTIDYTVADIHIAKLNALYYPNLDISLPISFEQHIAWAVRKNAPELLSFINKFLHEFLKTRYYNAVHYKYLQSPRQIYLSNSEFASINGQKISAYDKTIRKYSEIIDWDWLLLASLIYQESRFNHEITSRAGAMGIMQLMPVTAQKFGIDSASTAEEHIKAGVMYLQWLDRQLINKVICFEERKKFIIAAYNVGLGHIFDAQSLAEKHGKNPQIWFNNVDYYILNKSNPLYMNDTLVRHGMLRGRETVAMVRQIWDRYLHYQNLYEE